MDKKFNEKIPGELSIQKGLLKDLKVFSFIRGEGEGTMTERDVHNTEEHR